MTLLLVSLAGLGLFLWPFTGLGLPASTPALALAVGTTLVLLLVEVGQRRLDSRRLALLVTISTIDAAMRAAVVTGIGGFSPTFFGILCGGYVLGPSFGFACGTLSLLVSAVVTGGVGPWLPYQMLAAGWVGAGAGLAGLARRHGRPGRPDLILLGAVGAVSGLAFGALLDVWDWTFFRAAPQLGWSPGLAPMVAATHFLRFYLATSLAYDSLRAVGNALMVAAFGLPVLCGLRRVAARFTVVLEAAAVETAPPPAAEPRRRGVIPAAGGARGR
ncbi:MAG TPA: ECF transporter S component [Candidatus Micrarchaeia archaeon]|nr:ECF transporter S component [Candidatus Micrarchaeia archaeon]